jgi:ribonuclease Z
MRVTLLGTGCPIVDVHRYGPATLVEIENEMWLIDCGSGVTQRLLAHGKSGADITALLLTHLHSDHIVDFIQLLISGWHQGREAPLRVYGPRRTREFLGDLLAAWKPEMEQRIKHELRLPDGLQVEITEIDGNWEHITPNARITNTEVRHQPIPQAFGFRFDSQNASVVISGDTAYCPELITLAQGCDLLVHEAFVHWEFVREDDEASREHDLKIRFYHTATDEVGKVAREANTKHLVLTHWVPPDFDRQRVVHDVRAHYSGSMFIGDDLMSFDVADGCVSLVRGGVFIRP